MAKVIIGNEVAMLLDRGFFGAVSVRCQAWLNKELRASLEAREADVSYSVTAGKISKEGTSKASFKGTQVKAELADYAYTAFRLGQVIQANEKAALKEFGVMLKTEGLLPLSIRTWAKESQAEALEFFLSLDLKTADGKKAQDVAQQELDALVETEGEEVNA